MKITHESVWANVAENVCSLETSKKLWDADIRLVNSVCAWVRSFGGKFKLNYFFPQPLLNHGYEVEDSSYKAFPAPSSDDIERFITMNYKEYEIKLYGHYNEGKIMIECFDYGGERKYYKSKWYLNRAEALAEIALAIFAKEAVEK